MSSLRQKIVSITKWKTGEGMNFDAVIYKVRYQTVNDSGIRGTVAETTIVARNFHELSEFVVKWQKEGNKRIASVVEEKEVFNAIQQQGF